MNILNSIEWNNYPLILVESDGWRNCTDCFIDSLDPDAAVCPLNRSLEMNTCIDKGVWKLDSYSTKE